MYHKMRLDIYCLLLFSWRFIAYKAYTGTSKSADLLLAHLLILHYQLHTDEHTHTQSSEKQATRRPYTVNPFIDSTPTHPYIHSLFIIINKTSIYQYSSSSNTEWIIIIQIWLADGSSFVMHKHKPQTLIYSPNLQFYLNSNIVLIISIEFYYYIFYNTTLLQENYNMYDATQ